MTDVMGRWPGTRFWRIVATTRVHGTRSERPNRHPSMNATLVSLEERVLAPRGPATRNGGEHVKHSVRQPRILGNRRGILLKIPFRLGRCSGP